MLRLCIVLLALAALPTLAEAQILNPTTLVFPASADHNTTIGTTPVLDKYEALVVRQSATGSILYVTDLGKPTPASVTGCGTSCVTAPMPLSGTGGSAPNNTILLVAVRAVGPGGTSTSVFSDPFSVAGAPAAPGKPIPRTN